MLIRRTYENSDCFEFDPQAVVFYNGLSGSPVTGVGLVDVPCHS